LIGPRILVPYHLDEHLPGIEAPLTPDATVVAELPPGDAWQRMAVLYEQVVTTVADAVRLGGSPAVVSGDCMTSLGTVRGLQRAGLEPAMVWFDAHGDVQTLETTTSGYIGGLPLRILVGYRPELIATAIGLRPVAEDRVLLVDARDLDPPEVEYLARSAIGRRSVREAATALPDGPLYLHVDLDVVDPDDLPGLLFPAPGGPSLPAVAEALERVLATGRVAAVGVACTWQSGHGAGARVGPYLSAALAGS
jgi:arginase